MRHDIAPAGFASVSVSLFLPCCAFYVLLLVRIYSLKLPTHILLPAVARIGKSPKASIQTRSAPVPHTTTSYSSSITTACQVDPALSRSKASHLSVLNSSHIISYLYHQNQIRNNREYNRVNKGKPFKIFNS